MLFFSADVLFLTPILHLDKVKVVILGQDPNMMSDKLTVYVFRNEGTPHPKSLVNIFKELQNDIGFTVPKKRNLENGQTGILRLMQY